MVLAWAKSGVAFRSDQWGNLALWLFGLDLRPLGGVGDAARINASVFWYLGQEWFFYLVILPLLALLLALWKRIATAALLLALLLPLAWAVSIAVPLHGEDYLVWKSPWAFRLFLPVILSGMAVAALLSSARLRPLIDHPLTGWAALAVFLATISLSQFPYGWAMPGMVPFFLCVASGRHYNAVLSARPVVLLGNLSFSIYVLHPELLYALFAFNSPVRRVVSGWPAELTVPATMVLVVLLSALVHVLVERPSAALGNRVRQSLC
jgi:peptidoglycan/LPS O-acetylase OafA/YrhL